MKKGRHRRYEEARELKRSSFDDLDTLMERIDEDPFALPTTDQAASATGDDDDRWDDEDDDED